MMLKLKVFTLVFSEEIDGFATDEMDRFLADKGVQSVA